MYEFLALRAKAERKRDTLIPDARQQYERTLVQIATQERDLTGQTSRPRTIGACVEHALPIDREFSIDDVMAALKAIDDSRVWDKRRVGTHLTRLHKKGLIRRTKRHSHKEPALYVRNGVDVPTRPFADMSLADVVASILADKQMTQTELTVAVTEAGFETAGTRNELRKAIGVVLWKETERFRRERRSGRHWLSASAILGYCPVDITLNQAWMFTGR